MANLVLKNNTAGGKTSVTADEFIGNATSATKLSSSKTIALSGGVTGTATSFNGSVNISIPVTDIKEAYLSWGGKNLAGTISPVDVACSNIHNANRFAFANTNGITIEYSRDGSTYSTYTTDDTSKKKLVSGIGNSYYIGSRTSGTTINDKLRVTLNATNMGVYTSLKKLLINISTNYAKGSHVIVEIARKGSETTFIKTGDYPISGWSGWNSISTKGAFGGSSTQTSNIAVIRLTFGITGVGTSSQNSALTLLDIVAIGDTYWQTPSAMARTGHIYEYDANKNVLFPANVTAPIFIGSLSGHASSATKADYVSLQSHNELNFIGNSISEMWFNYKNPTTGTATTTKIDRYYFGNGQKGIAGVSLIADNFVGNASTATKLQTARTLTIGNKGKTFDGSGNITWTLPEIGAASLGSDGKVPSSQLPSYVDDVIDGYLSNGKFYKESGHTTQLTAESSKIYVDLHTNKTYRWSGSAYVEISASLVLGTTANTAFRGDYGNTAYSHASAKGSAFSSGLYKITTNAQGHVTAAAAVTKADITALGIPGSDTTYNFSGTTFYSGNQSIAEHNANNAIKNGHYYYSSNGPATSLGAFSDGALYVQSYSDAWVAQIAQDYRDGDLFVRGKNNGTWTTWKKVSAGTADSAANADKLDGYHGSPNQEALTYVLRNSAGYIYTNYIHSNTSNNENPSISQIVVTNGSDGFYRKASLAHLKTALGNMPASDVYAWAKASTKPSYSWNEITSKPINFIAYTGSLASGGWKALNGTQNSPSIAISYNNEKANWNSGRYSASLVWGCQDTRGLLDCSHYDPIVTFGGGAYSGSTDDNPKWYFKLQGTSGQQYIFPGSSKILCANDGSNASGTWGISITGNSATTTKLQNARTINGISFDGTSNIASYAVCDTAVDAPNKIVTCTGFQLASGAQITVKFSKGLWLRSDIATTLNVNGTGAKNIAYRGNTISGKSLPKNCVYTFVYDGTSFNLVGDIDQVNNGITVTGTPGNPDYNYPILVSSTIALRNLSSGEQIKSVQALSNSNMPTVNLSNGDLHVVGSITAASITGNISVATASGLLLNPFGRSASANINLGSSTYNSKVTYMLATSSMTTGKPPTDAHILSFGWDTTAGWGSQLAISDAQNCHLYIRGADGVNNNSSWESWKTVLDSSNYSTYALPKTGGTITGSLVLSRSNDVAETYYNNPALTIGGTSNQAHIEIDNNEIVAKANASSLAPLYLGGQGGNLNLVGNVLLSNEYGYGSSLPAHPSVGQMFFKI